MDSSRHTQLLNGWWDFRPVPHADLAKPLTPRGVPARGWKKDAYLVPGFFTDHPYPEKWRASRSGWCRTAFQVEESRLQQGQRAILAVKGAVPKAFLYVNGTRVGVQEDMFLGDAWDITAHLRPGANELAVFLTEFRTFPHPTSGKLQLIDVPWGCCIASSQAGLWQDVEIEWKPAVYVEDVTVRTSVREQRLTVITHVRNAGSNRFVGTLRHAAVDAGADTLAVPPAEIALEPGEQREVAQAVEWSNACLWFPEDPYLYHLRSELCAGAGTAVADCLSTRFGFREVWIEGHRVLLNGRPQRWGGEWCHKSHTHWLRPEYVRQWYRQLKDLNMNYVRMHTFPHPDYFLDIADEMGILICQETALHGSGQSGWDTPELWTRAEAHFRRLVRRDKNHPSLVIYSVENEMRWSLNIVPSAKDKLPGLRQLLNTLDPTRPAYHEGDTSLWNEEEQPIISRHYGPACHGMGWWDKRVPLHAGEMGRWHYASPYIAMQWAGDEVLADYKALSQSIARDAARIIELGRANEVSCMFPWNTSGLDNFRSGEARTFDWPEPNSRFAKPLAHKPYESEYAWWQPGSGCRPGWSYEILQRAFRPLALVIREERNQFYSGSSFPHTVYVVNDLPTPVKGQLMVWFECDGTVLWQVAFGVDVASGGTDTFAATVTLPQIAGGVAQVLSRLVTDGGTDEVNRALHITDSAARHAVADLQSGVAVVGSSKVGNWLVAKGVRPMQLRDTAELDAARHPIAIVGENTVLPGTPQNQHLQRYVAAGGRALLLEQTHSAFPGIPVTRQPIEMAFVRDPHHPVMEGITSDLLRFFGDDPFGLPSSDSWVTALPYVKPREAHRVRCLVDSSGGDFGTGGLIWAPVIEAQIGNGTLIASQLRFADRLDELPVASRFITNTLKYLAAFVPAPLPPPVLLQKLPEVIPTAVELGPALHLVSGAVLPSESPRALRQRLDAGATMIVWGLTPETAPVWVWQAVIQRQIEAFPPESPVYHLVANRRLRPASALLRGLSNEDTCWLENWTYTSVNRKEQIVEHLLQIEGAVVHLENPIDSGLDVLYGEGNATEWKRMPRLSAYFDGPKPRLGGALVEVPVGAGRVIFCQLRWKPDLWQFRRFAGMLLWNLGARVGTDILAGDTTPTAGCVSTGAPTELRTARVDGDATRQEILALAKRRAESYAVNMPFRQWPTWQKIPTPDGQFCAADLPGSGPILIGMEVSSPTPRKFMETLGGLPSPDLQTFLKLEGRGSVRAWINGAESASQPLNADAPTYISDIDFEAGSNFVVLEWTPDAANAALALCFENKDRRPETQFKFE
ncbi:MAG: hypothetical protein A3K19_00405 [Lentisphaerae bacterium RIFOXYB12_FULL_65_16]|nr:MAG: hypothetical protein A3K18_13975 [Lentisphaerae bacterium RIFOXYA12_64_32]OGV85334.1 MAG: hypothetical protein A3K19_00405 [Lentisphaerae bacterium RIFOXYB12_FULL_65_16]